MGGKRIRTIGKVRASFAMTMMVVIYNIKRLTFLERMLIRAVVCP
jgi:IS5 family transposase